MLCRAEVPHETALGHIDKFTETGSTNTSLTEIVHAHAIVHPRAMVIHAANASIANTAVVRHRWLEGLTLSAHTMGILHQSLSFRRNCGQRNTTRIRQTCLGMACQCHKYQYIVDHTENYGYPFSDCQKCDCHCRVQHQHPN